MLHGLQNLVIEGGVPCEVGFVVLEYLAGDRST